MKKKNFLRTFVALMAIFTFSTLNAQVQVGDGDINSRLPVNPYFGYSYSQSIYLASEINANGSITELSYNFSGTSLSNSNDWTIYIGHTSKSSFDSNSDWIDVSTLTQVYSGTFTDPGTPGWITIDITDWDYNGTDNIVIAVDENQSLYNGSEDKFKSFHVAGTTRSLSTYDDTNNPTPSSPPSGIQSEFIPNIIFGGITVSCPKPTGLAETNITSDAAELSWTAGGTETQWEVKYGTPGFDPNSAGTSAPATNNTFIITELPTATSYDWYVRANCGGGDNSVWAGPNNFTTLPSCPSTSDLAVSNITATTADLSWTMGGSESNWEIKYGDSGFSPDSEGNLVTTTTNSSTLTGLNSGKTYQWYVRANCGGGDYSVWAGPNTFTTLYGTHTLPLSEGFESGFTNFGNASENSVDFTIETNLQHSGSQCAKNAYSSYDENILIETGILDLSSTQAPILEFWHIAKTEGGFDKCYVEISTNGGETFTPLPYTAYTGAAVGYSSSLEYFHEDSYAEWGSDSYTVLDNTMWKKETFSLGDYKVVNVVIRFKLVADSGVQREGWYIDDILVDDPSCPAPSELAKNNLDATSVDLNWTENGSATTWEIEYSTSGFVQGSGTIETVTNNPSLTLQNLTAGTSYDWYVRASCGDDDYSTWVGPNTFKTEPITSTVDGNISKCSPVFVRKGGSGTYFYDKYTFTVPTDGYYDITGLWLGNFDGYIYLYENSFDPNNTNTNYITGADENGGGYLVGSKIENQELTAGTTYIVVATTYYANSNTNQSTVGSLQIKIEGPSLATGNATTDFNGVYDTYTHDPVSVDGNQKNASYECDDSQGYTHYYYDGGTVANYSDDELLISVKKNGQNIGSINDGTFDVFINGTNGTSHIDKTDDNYVNLQDGWDVMNRHWNLTPTTQPTAGVNVIFYYTDNEFNAIKTATSITNHTEMYAYKINSIDATYDIDPENGHSDIPAATTSNTDGAWILKNGNTPSLSEWKYTDLGGGFHSMEMLVDHFSGGGGGSSNGALNPLPLEILSFDGFIKNDVNVLRWTTAEELNVEMFEIERLDLTTEEFTTIAKMTAQNSRSEKNSYEQVDKFPLAKAYYRLKAVDFDGKYRYSKLIYIQREVSRFDIVNLYPNPSNSSINVTVLSPVGEKAIVEVTDLAGRVVYNEHTKLDKGSQNYKLNVESFENGAYILRMTLGSKAIKKIFIKQ